jgi:hypothetical protein
MDHAPRHLYGRGRWMDNVFIEPLWRSLKHEDIYLKGYADGREAHSGIAAWFAFYNTRRPHPALGNKTPMAVWRERTSGPLGDKTVDMGQRKSVAHMPTAATATAALRYGRMTEQKCRDGGGRDSN